MIGMVAADAADPAVIASRKQGAIYWINLAP